MSASNESARPAQNSLVPAPAAAAPAPLRQAARPRALTAPATNLGPAAVLHALRRRWPLALGTAVLGAAVAVVGAWVLLRPQATVRTRLLVSATPPKVLFPTADNMPTSREDLENFQKTQAALVRSRLVLSAALREDKVARLDVVKEHSDPIEWLEQELQVDNKVAPQILQISIRGDRPGQLATVVDAVREAYLNEIVDIDHNKRTADLERLKTILAANEASLREKRRTLENLAQNTPDAGSGDSKLLTLSHQFVLEQLSIANKNLMECQSEKWKLEAELGVMKAAQQPTGQSAPTPPVAIPPVDGSFLQDPVVMKHVQDIAAMRKKMKEFLLRSVHGKEDPKYQEYSKDLEAGEEALKERRQELAAAAVSQQQAGARASANGGLAQKAERLAVLGVLERGLDGQKKDLEEKAKVVGKTSLDVVFLTEEIARLEKMNNQIASETAALKVEVQAPPRVTKLESAYASLANAERRRYLGMGLGAFAALALSLAGVSWLELRARRITTPEEVQGLGVDLLGSVPWVDVEKRRRALAAGDRDPHDSRMLLESVDTARTMLLRAAQSNSLRVVMITSATGGEGKTWLSVQLASSLAYAGRKTLLVDCDLRKPTAHRAFGLEPGPGLGAVLQGAAKVEEALRQTDLEGLWVLPAGPEDFGAIRALAQDGIKPVLDQVRQQFDLIVLDSCPVLPVADSLLIAQHADAVVFSLLAEVSTLPATCTAWKRLEALGVPLLGAVFSGVRGSGYGYGYRSH
jgi:capsular exopolysaccharide synthesis family protein